MILGSKLFIDFRGKTVRAVEGRTAGKKAGFKVFNYGHCCMPESLELKLDEEKLDECARALESFLESSGMKSKKVIAGMGMNGIISRNARVPGMKMRDLDDMMRLEINEYLPVNPEEYYFDYKIVDDEVEDVGERHYDLILAAVPRLQSEQCSSIMEKAGLKPMVIDILPNMLHRLLVPVVYGDSLVLDGGIDGTHLAIFKDNELFMYADIPFTVDDESSDLSLLAREMRGYLDYYSSRNFGKVVDNVTVLGELAEIGGIKETLEQFLTMPVFVGFYGSLNFKGKAEGLREQFSLYAGNVGLMLRDANVKSFSDGDKIQSSEEFGSSKICV